MRNISASALALSRNWCLVFTLRASEVAPLKDRKETEPAFRAITVSNRFHNKMGCFGTHALP